MCAQNRKILRFCGIREHKRYGKPPHGYACRDRKIVPFEQFAQRGIVLPKIQHTAVKALTVAVSCTVNAPLKNMRRTEILQFLDVLGEQQPRVLIKPHIEFSGVLAEQPGQAGRRGRCGVQDDFAQAHAVHQRTAAELTHRISQFDAFKVSAVIKCITANTFCILRERNHADSRRIVLRLRAAAGNTDSERVLACQIGGPLAEYIRADLGNRHTVYLIRQTHNIVLRFAPQKRNAAARTPRTGQPQFVFALDHPHLHSCPFCFFILLPIIAQCAEKDDTAAFILIIRIYNRNNILFFANRT